MKGVFTLLLLITISSVHGLADPVSVQTANQVGKAFLTRPVGPTGVLSTKKLQISWSLVYMADTLRVVSVDPLSGKAVTGFVPYYVFGNDNQGYVIVAGDDRVIPILGYADEGTFDADHMPPNMQKWLEGYKSEIRFAIENNVSASSEIQSEWLALKSGTSIVSRSLASSVAPLISTKWNQSPYYNNLCPFNYTERERTVTGCVATAMAQVLKYWNYPATGTGFHSYNHSVFGTLSANFGSTAYNWANMPYQLTASSSPAEKDAVATLMYHCGISVDMNYNVASNGGSAAITICSGYSNCTVSAEDALKIYFGYKNTLKGVHKSNYANSNWINLLKTELDAGRPIIYAGRGDEGGHCFVCDGYDNNNFFHFNWGWAGQNDGYFALTALNPGSGGAGGGSFEFTDSQRAIVGIEPATISGSTTHNFDLRLSSGLNMSSTKIWFKSAFDLNVDVTNYGTADFSGRFGAAVFDNKGNFVDFIEIKYDMILNSNAHYTNGLTFATPGSASFVPGTYYAALFYKTETQDWTIVADGNYTNLISFEIYYSSDIEANSAFTITTNGGALIQGQPATVNVDVLNTGSSTFYGKYRVNLAHLDGSWAQNIQILNENNGLPYNYHYPNGNNFTGTITVPPGTYLMEIDFQTQGSSGWFYAGSTNYSNPVYVIVKSPEIRADSYEDNDMQANAYNLPISFSGDNATQKSNGSNLHIGTDIDYYKIVLPAGYNYTITPRLHDSYNSGNAQTYTVDALFSYSTDGVAYSETYDDVLTGIIQLNNGGSLYFKVAPYFSGNTGTYLLDMNVTRSETTGIKDVESNLGISLYPNPANSFVAIDLRESACKINRIVLLDENGRPLYTEKIKNAEGIIKLPLQDLSSGVYFVRIQSDEGITTKKLIVEK